MNKKKLRLMYGIWVFVVASLFLISQLIPLISASPALTATLYDSAVSNNVATNFNSTSILYIFNTDHYEGEATSTSYYSIFQKLSQGIEGFNMSTSMRKVRGSGQDLQIGFGDKEVTSIVGDVPMTCGVGNQPSVVNNGYLIGINRGRTQYGLYKVVSGAVTLLGSCKTISDPGDATFFPVNLTYDESTIEVYVNGVKDTISDSSYTLSATTSFGQAVYYGTSNGGQSKVKDMYIFNTPSDQPPTYSNAQTNSTTAGQTTKFSLLVNDDTALEPNGQYIFSTNNTGTWTNDSAVNFTTTPQWANVSKMLNDTQEITIGYKWYIKDNNLNLVQTPIYSFLIPDTTPPEVYLISPINNTFSSNLTQTFIVNGTDNIDLKTATLHIWNSTGDEITTTTDLTGDMWIADYNGGGHGYVTKVLPNGTSFAYSLTGTFNYAHWIAMDNDSNMWIVSYGSGAVEKVLPNGTSFIYSGGQQYKRYIAYNPSDNSLYMCGTNTDVERVLLNGTILTGIATLPGTACNAIAFDGVNMWFMSGTGGGIYSKLLPNRTLINYTTGAKAPNGVAFDGVNMWVGGGQTGNTQVSKININTGIITNYTVSSTQAVFPFYDGSSVWFESWDNATAIRFLSNGSIQYYKGLGLAPYGSAYNPSQRAMWFASRDSNIITKIYIDNGTMTNYTLPNSYDPHGMAFSGATLSASNPPYGVSNTKINSISGISNQTSWDYNLSSIGTYLWNVNVCDNAGNCAFNSTNYTITITLADTCTCPGAGNDWEIDMSDYCNITEACDLTTGTLSFTGTGITRINSTIKTTNLGDPGANGILKWKQ